MSAELQELELLRQVQRERHEIEVLHHQNLELEFRLDHSRDRHVGARLAACPACEEVVIPSIHPTETLEEIERVRRIGLDARIAADPELRALHTYIHIQVDERRVLTLQDQADIVEFVKRFGFVGEHTVTRHEPPVGGIEQFQAEDR